MSARNALVRQTAERRAEPAARSGESGSDPAPGWFSLTPERGRTLALVAARPAIIALAVLIALVVVTLLAAGEGLATAPAVVAATWLGANQIPLPIGRTTLGLLPLLPTALLVWAVGREVVRALPARPTRVELTWVAAAAVAGPLLVTAIGLAVADDASGVLPLQAPHPLAAFGWVSVLCSVAVAGAVLRRCGAWFVATTGVPDWAVAGFAGARRTVLRMLACAAVVTLMVFVLQLPRLGDTYRAAGDIGGVLGLTVLSLAYLPNVIAGTVGVLAGSTVQFGSGEIGLFAVLGGPVPAVPVLNAVPSGPAAAWWAVLLLIPAGVGVLGGVDLGRITDDRPGAPWATLTSAVLATLALAALAVAGGGQLGEIGPVGLDLPMFLVLTVTWFGVGGFAGMVFARRYLAPVFDYYDRTDRSDDVDDYDADDFLDDELRHDETDSSTPDPGAPDDEPHPDTAAEAPDAPVEIDAELLDEPEPVTMTGPGAGTTTDIVDAEVVEPDLPDGGAERGR